MQTGYRLECTNPGAYGHTHSHLFILFLFQFSYSWNKISTRGGEWGKNYKHRTMTRFVWVVFESSSYRVNGTVMSLHIYVRPEKILTHRTLVTKTNSNFTYYIIKIILIITMLCWWQLFINGPPFFSSDTSVILIEKGDRRGGWVPIFLYY